jgi:hypothetical protein
MKLHDLNNSNGRDLDPVPMCELFVHGSKWLDQEFRAWVLDTFMPRHMPDINWRMLEQDWERWEHDWPDMPEVEERWSEDGEECEFLVVQNWPCSRTLKMKTRVLERFDNKYDANRYAEEEAESDRHLHGFPFASYHAHMPTDSCRDVALRAAGFVLAHYIGPDGDRWRMAGIDGGGYSFELTHWAELAVYVAYDREWLVPTEKGLRLVTPDTRPVMEQLADACLPGGEE